MVLLLHLQRPERVRTLDKRHALSRGRMQKSVFRRSLNRTLGKMARLLPGATTLRPFLHRLRGVQISGEVFIGDDVYLENEFPERVELHDGCQICVRSILLAHTRGPGRIIVEREAFIGANTVVTAGSGQTVTIGEGAVVTASSVIATDVPKRTLVGTPKARVLADVTVPFKMATTYEQFLAGLRPRRRPVSRRRPRAATRETHEVPVLRRE